MPTRLRNCSWINCRWNWRRRKNLSGREWSGHGNESYVRRVAASLTGLITRARIFKPTEIVMFNKKRLLRRSALVLFVSLVGLTAVDLKAAEGAKQPPQTASEVKDIDWNKAKELMDKWRRREKLTADEQAYLERAPNSSGRSKVALLQAARSRSGAAPAVGKWAGSSTTIRRRCHTCSCPPSIPACGLPPKTCPNCGGAVRPRTRAISTPSSTAESKMAASRGFVRLIWPSCIRSPASRSMPGRRSSWPATSSPLAGSIPTDNRFRTGNGMRDWLTR